MVPVVDTARSAVCSHFLQLNDNFLISLMFFLSGLFLWSGIRRHGALHFLRGRLLRLGLPFAVAATILMPIAYYPSWILAHRAHGYFAFLPHHFGENGWPPGPPWFIWVLLSFDFAAAALFSIASRVLTTAPITIERFAARLAPITRRPLLAYALLLVLTIACYLPMVLHAGSESWRTLFFAPFYFQTCRVFVYFTWFSAGIIYGIQGIDNTALAEDGPLARRWPLWAAAAIAAFALAQFYREPAAGAFALAQLLHAPGLARLLSLTPAQAIVAQALTWVISCTTLCFGLLAFFQAKVRRHRPWMDSLTRSAYILYVVHYIFVSWIQYALLPLSAPGLAKAALVFVPATLLSWITAQLLLRIRPVAAVV